MSDKESDKNISRRNFLKTSGAGIGLAVAPTSTAKADTNLFIDDNNLSPAIRSSIGFFGVESYQNVIRYGASSHPEFIVDISESKDGESLNAWVEESKKRALRQEISETEYVISAPFSHVAGRNSINVNLAGLEYVDRIYYNTLYKKQVVKNLETSSSWTKPEMADITTLITKGSFSGSELAYSDNSEVWKLGEAANIVRQETSNTGKNVKVSVLDTGCNVTNSGDLFGDRIKMAKDFANGGTGVEAVEDGDGHGTWCCAAVGADPSNSDYQGVAPDCDLMVGKVMGDDGSGATSDIVEGIRWSVENGADVISMSLGSPLYNKKLEKEVEKAVDEGVTVVIAAGNSRYSARWVASPADTIYDGVLSVGATNNAKPSEMKSAYFSQVGTDSGMTDGSEGETRGATVQIGCSGMKIEAKVVTSTGSTKKSTLSGTSMATPQIAGGIACILESEDLNPSDVEDRVEKTANPAKKCGVTEVGGGILNVEAAVKDTKPEETQEEARVSNSVKRDLANKSYSGTIIEKLFKDSNL